MVYIGISLINQNERRLGDLVSLLASNLAAGTGSALTSNLDQITEKVLQNVDSDAPSQPRNTRIL